MTRQERLGAQAVSNGHFQKDNALEENRVKATPATLRTSIDPWKDTFGSRIRQSPQICCAFHCHASIRSDAGSKSVENSCDMLYFPWDRCVTTPCRVLAQLGGSEWLMCAPQASRRRGK